MEEMKKEEEKREITYEEAISRLKHSLQINKEAKKRMTEEWENRGGLNVFDSTTHA